MIISERQTVNKKWLYRQINLLVTAASHRILFVQKYPKNNLRKFLYIYFLKRKQKPNIFSP